MSDNTFITGIDYLNKFPGFALVGRDTELENLRSILLRSNSSSVILTGAGGVGCSALTLGIQASKSLPDAPFDIFSKRFWWLDTDALFSDENLDARNQNINRILAILRTTPNSVVVVENTRSLIDNCRNTGTMWLVSNLFSMIRDKRIQMILETHEDSLDVVLSIHSDVKELFTLFPLDEPKGAALAEIVKSAAAGLEAHHGGIAIDEEARKTAIEVTNKYAASDTFNRAQPDRAVTLLDRSLSTLRLSAHRSPDEFSPDDWAKIQKDLKGYHNEVRSGEVAINRMRDEKGALAATRGAQGTAGLSTTEEDKLSNKIAEYEQVVAQNRSAYDDLTRKVNARLKLTGELVLREFERISGIPADRLQENDTEKLITLESALLKRIFGQDEAVHQIAGAFKVAGMGREEGDTRPKFAFLFMGPSGVGKTEIAKACAAHMFSDERALIRFDMSEYSEKHAAAKLIGAPPGYEGYSEGGILTNIARRRKGGIMLFDEIEKGHPDVYDIFLQLLSEGRLTDNHGRTESFEGFGIMMTTNIGQSHFLNPEITFQEATRLAMVELGERYKNEFLNRFAGKHNILGFRSLGIDSIQRIVQREFGKLQRKYSRRGIELESATACMGEFCRENYEAASGARGLPGFIEVNLETKIVDLFFQGGFDKANPRKVMVDYHKAEGFVLEAA